VLDLEALTKISRQLDVSMGNMMGMVNAFAIGIYMVVIYLLSKIIIEKNAQAISMTKILGYTNGEISRLYIWSTTIVVIICLLLSLPIEKAVMNVLFREMMLTSISGWIALWIDPKIYVEMFLGIGTYAVVAMLEYRRIKHVPMDEALKNVE
jgi:putative ABC transport system permease protein